MVPGGSLLTYFTTYCESSIPYRVRLTGCSKLVRVMNLRKSSPAEEIDVVLLSVPVNVLIPSLSLSLISDRVSTVNTNRHEINVHHVYPRFSSTRASPKIHIAPLLETPFLNMLLPTLFRIKYVYHRKDEEKWMLNKISYESKSKLFQFYPFYFHLPEFGRVI